MIRRPALSAALLALASAAPAPGQCVPAWLPGDQGQFVRGNVWAMVPFDPDGPGPQPTKLFIGGQGLSVAGLADQLVMAWNGQSWEAVAASADPNDAVLAMAVHQNALHVGGRFLAIGGVGAANVAKLSAGAWTPLGGGLTGGEVRALATIGVGTLYAGGTFTAVGGGAAGSAPLIASWSGGSWSGVGSGIVGTSVDALALGVTALYIGGNFSNAGGSGASRLARWTGSAYAPVGTTPNGVVKALAVFSNPNAVTPVDTLFVGGDFTTIGGIASPDVAIYRSFTGTWSAAGGLTASGECRALHVRALTPTTYELYAVGFQSGSPALTPVGRWTGSGWATLGSSPTAPRALAYFGANLMMGGVSVSGSNVLSWDGAAWRPFGPGVGGPPAFTPALATDASGAVVLAGVRSALTAAPASAVVRRDPATGAWAPLGEANETILAAAIAPGGEVYIGGRFTTAGGAAASLFARRSAAGVWSGPGLTGPAGSEVRAIAVLPGGEVVAGGQFAGGSGVAVANVALWNGAAWTAMGAGLSGPVNVLRVLPGGDLVAAGDFASSGAATLNNVARWNGSAWVPYGLGVNGPVEHLVPYLGGFVVTGSFGTAGTVSALGAARWTGSAWASMTGGIPYPVGALGTLDGAPATVSFSPFTSTPRSSPVYRFDGSVWQTVGSASGGYITALADLPGGAMAAAGDFTTAGGGPGAFFARIARGNAACPADHTCAAGVDLLDIFAFLADWFAAAPRADFNRNGQVDLLDIFAFLAAWFAGC